MHRYCTDCCSLDFKCFPKVHVLRLGPQVAIFGKWWNIEEMGSCGRSLNHLGLALEGDCRTLAPSSLSFASCKKVCVSALACIPTII
jgi:hypothetical protein